MREGGVGLTGDLRRCARNSVEFFAHCKEQNMKFLSTWSLRTDTHREATTRFLKSGAQPPEGIKTIGRWHYADGSGGVHVVECDDAQLLADFAAQWSDLLEIDIRPVVEDAQAGAALMKASEIRK
jgi:Protein of unknown function (DUF3303)